jgi:hypothetical protein
MSDGGDTLTVNMDIEVSEDRIREVLRDELRHAFGCERVLTCEECGLVWTRNTYYRRSDHHTMCPDCGEEHRITLTNI